MYPILPGVNAWNVSNLPDPTKRAIGIGYLICMGNAGGLIGSFIYKEKEAPWYVTGYGSSIAFAICGSDCLPCAGIFSIQVESEEGQDDGGPSPRDVLRGRVERDGEKSPLFKYNL